MKEFNLEMFDLSKALVGGKVATRSGHLVSQITKFHGLGDLDLCLSGVVHFYNGRDNELHCWNADGSQGYDEESHLDLQMVRDPCKDKPLELNKGEIYYSPNITNDSTFSVNVWGDGGDYEYDRRMSERGMVHLTKEEAIEHSYEILGYPIKL